MSVYSGFATRQMEQHYNHLVKTLLIILAKRINKIYTQKPCNEEAFKQILLKVLCNMSLMERHKYMYPKYTENVLQLVEIFSANNQFLNLNNFVTEVRPSTTKPPLRVQPIRFDSDMPRPPTFQPPLFQPAMTLSESGPIKDQIKQTQDQINALQQNLNSILEATHQKPSELNLKDDHSQYTAPPQRTLSNRHDMQQQTTEAGGLKSDEVFLIENMLKQRKIQRKKKVKKNKRKRCTFEKLLIEFYDDYDAQDDKMNSSVGSRKDQSFNIRQARSTTRNRGTSLYK